MNEPFDHRAQPASADARVDKKKAALVCSLILLGAGGLAALTFLTEPTAKRSGATKKTAMLVEVTPAERGTFRPVFVVTGTVMPEEDILLRAQVSGQIIERTPAFTPGGFVEEGQTLLRIQPADYENTLEQRRSELRQALSELDLEMGRQRVAQAEHARFGADSASATEALMLRKPQLEAAQVRVQAARAAVDQAELDLQRTLVEAPFAAQILSREVSRGSLITSGDPLGRLVGVGTYWVMATLPLAKLRFIAIPDREHPQLESAPRGSEVRIRDPAAWPEGAYRTGRLFRLIGALDQGTRLARLLVTVSDPLARDQGQAAPGPGLMVGQFVEVRIPGNEIENVVALDRDYVRDGDTVWLMEDDRLRVREVAIAVRDAERAYITSGLAGGDRVVTTNLATVTEGARLRAKSGGGTARR